MAELSSLTQLCLRSKAHWGYSDTFIQACRDELTLTADQVSSCPTCVAQMSAGPVGVAQILVADKGASLEKLFVDPPAMGLGVGRRLFAWSVATARSLGAVRLEIVSDPQAVDFYIRQGAERAGVVASDSIPGRSLPRLILSLD